MVCVSYQGVPGAYSEKAAFSLLGRSIEALGYPSFEETFEAVNNASVTYGILPIENSLGGCIHKNYDLLLRNNLYIIAEIDFRVVHCLLALPGVQKKDIKQVFSHPQALAQCSDYLKKMNFLPVVQYDTAGSAKILQEIRRTDTAVIASDLAAEYYDLEVLEEGVEDDEVNFTRFLLLSRQPQKLSLDVEMKTSIVFSFGPNNLTGQLHQVLSLFSDKKIDLTKIESRPAKIKVNEESLLTKDKLRDTRKKYEYIFYIDFLGHIEEDHIKNILKSMDMFCSFVRVFGSYPTNGILIEDIKKSLKQVQQTQKLSKKEEEKKRLLIGIIGFGNFGQFLAKTFIRYHDVLATSRSDYNSIAIKLGCKFIPFQDLRDFFNYKLDIVILSTSILSFDSLVQMLPKDLLNNLLIVDVLSVKVHPKNILLTNLPKSCDILCTHPMFGPESGRFTWKSLPFMYEAVRISDESKCLKFLSIFESEKCKMIQMTCEQHDEYAASNQFITHLTGRILKQQDLVNTPIDTAGFRRLLELVEQTCKDSFDLFYGLFKYNAKSIEQLYKLEQSFNFVKRRLEKEDLDKKKANEAINPLIQAIKPSKTIVIHALTKDMEDKGFSVYSLCVGEPDFRPHSNIIQATKDAVDSGDTRYTGVSGTIELRQSICQYLKDYKNVVYQPDEILVANGGKQAIYQAILSICSKGDEVIIPSPYWVSYPEIVHLSGAIPVILKTTIESGYLIDPQELAKLITSNTRALILCNPCNPTGAMHPKDILEKIAMVLKRPEYQHVTVISDEIYERLEYDTPHISFSSLDGMWSRTLTINGFSKAYAMTGYRLGYLAAPREFIIPCTILQGQITSCANSISQKAAIAALQLPKSDMDKIVKEMRFKRDFTAAKLKEIPHVLAQVTEGAFYFFPNISWYFGKLTPTNEIIGTCDAFCVYLLKDFHTAVIPGSAFGDPNAIRLSFATDIKTLDMALCNLSKCLASLHDPPISS